ncbi:MAG: (d)CMP kinase, partial [Gammaproteobacteria bacterium]|nr:(d)CMP kinase [Gammaproteobacteria bacterium]
NPVITIDGPAASGKGTLAQRLSAELGFNLLDSGLLYRIVAYTATLAQLPLHDENALESFIQYRLRFKINEEPSRDVSQGVYEAYIFKQVGVEDIVSINNRNVNLELRSPETGVNSSVVSAIREVRKLLIPVQRSMRTPPGLVADGRDMGTVVFPDAQIKFYLDASVETRARRRLDQLQKPCDSDSLEHMIAEIEQRDERDRTREVAPLVASEDAVALDTTSMSIDEVFAVTRSTVITRLAI